MNISVERGPAMRDHFLFKLTQVKQLESRVNLYV